MNILGLFVFVKWTAWLHYLLFSFHSWSPRWGKGCHASHRSPAESQGTVSFFFAMTLITAVNKSVILYFLFLLIMQMSVKSVEESVRLFCKDNNIMNKSEKIRRGSLPGSPLVCFSFCHFYSFFSFFLITFMTMNMDEQQNLNMKNLVSRVVSFPTLYSHLALDFHVHQRKSSPEWPVN